VANATDIVKKGVVRRSDEFRKRSAETLASATRFHTHAMVGVDTTGYYCKGDDAQSWVFAGVVRGDEGSPLLPAGTAGDGTIDLDVHMPFAFELAVPSVAADDVGKTVYALDDQTGTLDPTAVTYANVVGKVVDVAGTGIALVEPVYDGPAANERLMAVRVLPATGAVTLTKFDAGKTICCPNTAAQAVTLPLVADSQLGARFTFVKTTSDAFAITLTRAGSDTINGANTLATMDAQYDTHTLVAAAAALWNRVSSIIA
jgi:hypothetical protein